MDKGKYFRDLRILTDNKKTFSLKMRNGNTLTHISAMSELSESTQLVKSKGSVPLGIFFCLNYFSSCLVNRCECRAFDKKEKKKKKKKVFIFLSDFPFPRIRCHSGPLIPSSKRWEKSIYCVSGDLLV